MLTYFLFVYKIKIDKNYHMCFLKSSFMRMKMVDNNIGIWFEFYLCFMKLCNSLIYPKL